MIRQQIQKIWDDFMQNYKDYVHDKIDISGKEYLIQKLGKEDGEKFYDLYIRWVSYDMGCVKSGKERISCPDYIYKNWISKEDIINYWKTRKPFSELPFCDVPNYKDKEFYRKEVVPLIVALGAVPKDQLQIGHWYEGTCRNTSKAQWDGEKFWYKRYKWGSTYNDDIDHFDSNVETDVFIPFKEIECKENLI